MKTIGIVGTAGLLLLFGIAAPAGARQEKAEKQEEKAKPDKQEQHAKPERQQRQAKPERQQQAKGQRDQQRQQRQQQDKSAQQDQQRQGQQRQRDSAERQQQAKVRQDQQRQQHSQQHQQSDNRSAQHRSPAEVHQQRVAWRGNRAHSWQAEHRDWQQRGGYHGYRVPDDRFRSYYGQDHGFRIYSLPVLVVGGQRRFQYGGYWFSFVDVWPSNWLYTQDVFVVEIDGMYYLCTPMYPGVNIAINVTL